MHDFDPTCFCFECNEEWRARVFRELANHELRMVRRRVAEIAHDLFRDCECTVCRQVDVIRARYA